jgi:hypothetical protein
MVQAETTPMETNEVDGDGGTRACFSCMRINKLARIISSRARLLIWVVMSALFLVQSYIPLTHYAHCKHKSLD